MWCEYLEDVETNNNAVIFSTLGKTLSSFRPNHLFSVKCVVSQFHFVCLDFCFILNTRHAGSSVYPLDLKKKKRKLFEESSGLAKCEWPLDASNKLYKAWSSS